jgi:murein DD-endopeptidase MepM/ murein hydrolase activator NlpD
MPDRNLRRGASSLDPETPIVPHRHVVAVAALSVAVFIIAVFMPADNVEAKRHQSTSTSSFEEELDAAMFEIAIETADSSDADPAQEHLANALADTQEGQEDATAEQTVQAGTTSDSMATAGWRTIEVRAGDNLSLIFKRAGFNDTDVHRIVKGSREGASLTRLFPGQRLEFLRDNAGHLAQVRYQRNALETLAFTRDGDLFVCDIEQRQPEVRERFVTATITSSLFLAGRDAGLSHSIVMALADIFGGVIDFVADPRKGDTIDLVYEEQYLDGEKIGDGAILLAAFTNRGKEHTAFRYEDTAGHVAYYSHDGLSLRRAFLLAPVDFTRVSSEFNPRRLHPIYKTTRPHRGIDYAAPTGTPVYSAGDGKVIEAGYNRANGNYIFIQHGDRYVTKYLHLHQKRVKQGGRVAQGQVIGTVGSTGAATGPHLHYEFLIDGVHRNPRTVHQQLPKASQLASMELPRFRSHIAPLRTQLASARQAASQLALGETQDGGALGGSI